MASDNHFFYTENNQGNSFLLIKKIFNIIIFNIDEIGNNILEEHIINIDTIYDCYKIKKKNEGEDKLDDEEKIFEKSKSVNFKKKRTYPK